ncbi:cell division protein ZapB [Actinobacillus delphinicola]|uniref:Cell division protein ZapB n=1 Tax=Actinobacillus delphinicola TaxID=51161 RepID=A0A448TTG0_9PAST|nr:cell division protein ZapB [Actinobacillus delphinicola]MDG6897483.1 cell division protein ZapB [Actinobacillus delphinicola]VEJ09292.1 Cell division protein ZapB [Actinobacillus delphinicola]
MSFEILDQLEGKIKEAVETIQLLQLEIEELKGKNQQLSQENESLKSEHNDFQDRLRALLGRIDNV